VIEPKAYLATWGSPFEQMLKPSLTVRLAVPFWVMALWQVEFTNTPEPPTMEVESPERVNGSEGQPLGGQPGMSETTAFPSNQGFTSAGLARAIAMTLFASSLMPTMGAK